MGRAQLGLGVGWGLSGAELHIELIGMGVGEGGERVKMVWELQCSHISVTLWWWLWWY